MADKPTGMYSTAGLLLSASVVRYSGQLIMLVLIARLGNAESVGVFTVALAICAPVYILAGFGIRTVHLTLPRPMAPPVCERFLLSTLAAAYAVIIVIAVLLPPEIGRIVLLVAVIRTGETYAELYGAMLQRSRRPRVILVAASTGTLMQVTALSLVLLRDGSLTAALAASALVYWCNLLVLPRRIAVREASRPEASEPRVPGQWRVLFIAGLPTGIAIGMITLLSTVPQYLLGVDGDIAAAGQFAVLLYTVVAVETVLHALAQSWIPYARALLAASALSVVAVLRAGLRWTLLGGVPGLVGLAAAAAILPAALGPDFAVSAKEAAPLACAILLVPGAFAVDTAIVVRNRYALSMVVSVCALACGSVLGTVLLLREQFGLTGALWTFAATMAIRAAGGLAALAWAGSAGSRLRTTPRLGRGVDAVRRLGYRSWLLVPVAGASTLAVLAGPDWVLAGTAIAAGAGLLLLLRLRSAEIVVITAPLAFYVSAGGVLVNLAVSDALLLVLLVRVLLDPALHEAGARTAGAVRLALTVLALLTAVNLLTILVRSGAGAEVDWTAFLSDLVKLTVVLAYFCVCLVVFCDLLMRRDFRFLRLWALTAAVVGALGVAGALLFAAGVETGLTMDFRAIGTFEDPNAFSTYLILSVPLTLLGRMLSGRSALSWHLIPILAGIVASFSRGALVGIAAVLLLLCLLAFRSPRLRALRFASLAALLVSVAAVAQGLIDRLFADNRGVGFGDDVRFRLWSAAVELWRESPVFGVGMGQFVVSSENMVGSSRGVLAHNTFLSILAEGGAVGFALFLAVPLAAVVSLLRRGGVQSSLLLIAGVGTAVMALSLNLQNFRPLWMLLALAAAYALAPEADEESSAPLAPGLRHRVTRNRRARVYPDLTASPVLHPTARTEKPWI